MRLRTTGTSCAEDAIKIELSGRFEPRELRVLCVTAESEQGRGSGMKIAPLVFSIE